MTDKKHIYKLFDLIADKYEFVNHVLSCFLDIRWRRKLAVKIPKDEKISILDICCGSGSQTLAILQNCENACCLGIDLSEELLKLAVLKIKENGFDDRAFFQRCDATALTFADKYFGFVTVSFGIRNIYDRDKCFKEVKRVLSQNGSFLILEFSMPENPLLKLLFKFYLNSIVPVAGRIITGRKEAYNYLRDSITDFSEVDILSELTRAGFKIISVDSLSFGAVKIYEASN